MPGPFETLRNRHDFQKLYNEGQTFHGRFLVCAVRRSAGPPARLAFIAGRKVGKAVQRNRARRLLREAFRSLDFDVLEENVDIAFIARAACPGQKMQVVRNEMHDLLAAAGLLERRGRPQTDIGSDG
ncbi:MAG: ribonuclease P protein component [Candidatus Eisenbacteria bacterium]|nr:ribonuclease P protein component [Candidatus Eisenbacteria bacterium]